MEQRWRKLPPLPFFFAVFTEPSHDLLLQVRNRKALERWVTNRWVGGWVVGRGQKLDSLPGELLRRVVGGRIIGHHFETGNVVLKHIRDVLESPEIEKRPSFELQSHFEARRQTQSRVQEIESCCDLALFLSRNQASSVFHILVHDLNKCNIGTEPIYSSTKHTETESKL